MVLNCIFNPFIDSIILLNKPLTDWFERNQETMAYFELTHAGCSHLDENFMASYDIKVLGKMANASLSWLESKKWLSPAEKAENAMRAIAEIYDLEKEKLSETAQQLYAINYGIEKTNFQESKLVKKLPKRNGIKNNRPGKGHRNH